MFVVPCTPLVTTPVVTFTAATVVTLLLQVPFVEELVKVIVEPPAHICALPPVVAGVALTVTVTTAVPQPLS